MNKVPLIAILTTAACVLATSAVARPAPVAHFKVKFHAKQSILFTPQSLDLGRVDGDSGSTMELNLITDGSGVSDGVFMDDLAVRCARRVRLRRRHVDGRPVRVRRRGASSARSTCARLGRHHRHRRAAQRRARSRPVGTSRGWFGGRWQRLGAPWRRRQPGPGDRRDPQAARPPRRPAHVAAHRQAQAVPERARRRPLHHRPSRESGDDRARLAS
jgi:hypothetical protein